MAHVKAIAVMIGLVGVAYFFISYPIVLMALTGMSLVGLFYLLLVEEFRRKK